jgi:acetolactate synthase-1/2/3 large subunit
VPLGPSVRERETLQLAVRPRTKIVHITLFESERQSFVSDTMWLVPVAVPIAAHTSIALPQLLELCRRQLGSQADAVQRIEARRARVVSMHAEAHKRAQAWIEQNWKQKPISSARLYGELNARLKGQSWALVHAHGRRWREVLEVTESGHGIGGGRGAGVGYGLPASIGAALGYKGSGRLCVSVLGDGDFLMTSNALWTAARYSIPLLITVFNNRSYYNDEEHQERMAVRRERPVDNKGIGVDLKDPAPDLAAMARALCVEGFGPITEPDQLGPTLDRAIEIVRSGQPAVIDVVTQPR